MSVEKNLADKFNFLDFGVLFILSFLFTQAHQVFPTSTFPDYLYLPLFGLLLIYLFLCLTKLLKNNDNNWTKFAKILIFSLILAITVGRTAYSAIKLRHRLGNDYPVHDNPIQIEEGVKYLLQGKNPYSENYLNTPLEAWHNWKENPALYHFVTLPFYLLFSLLISLPANLIFGFFDERMVHIIVFLITISLIYKLVKPVSKKIFYLSLFSFNPLFIHFFIEGRNDVFVFNLLFMSLLFLRNKRYFWSALSLGLATASKQSSWLILPFYFSYLYWREDFKLKFIDKLKKVFQKTWFFLLIIILMFGPFLIWDSKSFIEDIYLYPAGGLKTSYMIKGFGLSPLLLKLGLIESATAYYPFWIWQITLGGLVLAGMLIILRKRLKMSVLSFSYMAFLWTFWLLSRFFNDNYVGYLSMIFIMAMIFLENDLA